MPGRSPRAEACGLKELFSGACPGAWEPWDPEACWRVVPPGRHAGVKPNQSLWSKSHLSFCSIFKIPEHAGLVTGLQKPISSFSFSARRLTCDGGIPSCPQLWMSKSNSLPCAQTSPIGFCLFAIMNFVPEIYVRTQGQPCFRHSSSKTLQSCDYLPRVWSGYLLNTPTPHTTPPHPPSHVFLTVGMPQAFFLLMTYAMLSFFVAIFPYACISAPGSLGPKTERHSPVNSSKWGFIIGLHLHKQLELLVHKESKYP